MTVRFGLVATSGWRKVELPYDGGLSRHDKVLFGSSVGGSPDPVESERKSRMFR